MAQPAIEEKKVVIFKIGDEDYATGIGEVERIIDFEKVTKIPEAPEYLKGVINNQGRIIPIIDLRRRFGLSDSNVGADSSIIIAREDKGNVGLIVDAVSEITDVTDNMMSQPPDVVSGIIKKYIKKIIKMDNRVILYLNLEEILDFNEKKEIEEIIK